MSYFHNAAEREAKALAPGIQAKTFWGEKMMMSLVDIEPNSALPLHSHPHEQQGIVISGELEMTIGGETQLIKPGDLYVIPGGVEHGAKTGATGAQVLDIFDPVRDEYKY